MRLLGGVCRSYGLAVNPLAAAVAFCTAHERADVSPHARFRVHTARTPHFLDVLIDFDRGWCHHRQMRFLNWLDDWQGKPGYSLLLTLYVVAVMAVCIGGTILLSWLLTS